MITITYLLPRARAHFTKHHPAEDQTDQLRFGRHGHGQYVLRIMLCQSFCPNALKDLCDTECFGTQKLSCQYPRFKHRRIRIRMGHGLAQPYPIKDKKERGTLTRHCREIGGYDRLDSILVDHLSVTETLLELCGTEITWQKKPRVSCGRAGSGKVVFSNIGTIRKDEVCGNGKIGGHIFLYHAVASVAGSQVCSTPTQNKAYVQTR